MSSPEKAGEPPHWSVPPVPVTSAARPMYDEMVAQDRIECDPDVLRRGIARCQQHADDMGEFADQARRDLRVDKLGFGEEHLSNSMDLLRKYQDKAVGGGMIPESSSAYGNFAERQQYVLDMKLVLEASLRRYEEQEGINTTNIGNAGGDL